MPSFIIINKILRYYTNTTTKQASMASQLHNNMYMILYGRFVTKLIVKFRVCIFQKNAIIAIIP